MGCLFSKAGQWLTTATKKATWALASFEYIFIQHELWKHILYVILLFFFPTYFFTNPSTYSSLLPSSSLPLIHFLSQSAHNRLLPIVSYQISASSLSPQWTLQPSVCTSPNTVFIISLLIQEHLEISELHLLSSPQSETSTNHLNASSATFMRCLVTLWLKEVIGGPMGDT